MSGGRVVVAIAGVAALAATAEPPNKAAVCGPLAAAGGTLDRQAHH